MSPAAHKGFPLALAQEDEHVRILGYRADKGIERKMRDMGMPIGAEVRIVQHKGAGVVLANGHGRIALGSSAAQLVYVELVDDDSGCTADRCAAFAKTNAKLEDLKRA